MRVLIIEDSEDTAFCISHLLLAAGHETRLAVNGEEALQLAADFQPEAALLDLQLPNMDGYEVATRLRTLAPSLRLHIIALSGINVDECRDLAAGIDHHLMKPVQFIEVLNALQTGHAELLPARLRLPI